MRNRVVLVVSAIVALVVLYYLTLPPSYSWYYYTDARIEQPYGLKMYNTLFEDYFEDSVTIQTGTFDKWNLDSVGDNVGLIVKSNGTFKDSTEYFTYDSLVQLGHHAYFYYTNFDKQLYYFLQGKERPERDSTLVKYWNYDAQDTNSYYRYHYENKGRIDGKSIIGPTIESVFIPTDVKSSFHYAIENDSIYWHPPYVDFGTYYERWMLNYEFEEWEPLVYINGDENKITAFRVPKGKGYVYVVSCLAPFTNYCFGNEENFQFASDFTALYPKDFLWYGSYYPYVEQSDFNSNRDSSSPLKFLISNRSLRWAWYVLISSLFLFLLFRTQRKQRIIPVINAKKNQSLEFAKSLGLLQSKVDNNHAHTALEIKRQFRFWTRSRFPRITEIDHEYKELLMQMLPEAKEDIRRLFLNFERAQKRPELFTASDLNTVYTVTRYIYDHV